MEGEKSQKATYSREEAQLRRPVYQIGRAEAMHSNKQEDRGTEYFLHWQRGRMERLEASNENGFSSAGG